MISSTGSINGEIAGQSSEAAPKVIDELQQRCNTLLREVQEFKTYIETHNPEQPLKLNALERSINADNRSLQKLTERLNQDSDDESVDKIKHALRSSNVPFYETVWATAKRSKGVVGFSKRFYPRNNEPGGDGTPVASKRHKSSVLVDIVADNKSEWIKVSTITETRLIFEMAKQGWERGDETSGSESDSSSIISNQDRPGREEDEDDRVSILRMAEQLSRMAKDIRICYRHPRVRLVLPKIAYGRIEEIDTLLDNIRTTGVILETANDVASLPPQDLTEEVLARMAVDQYAGFSATLNIDCTILLALVSDLSHLPVSQMSWRHPATKHQIETEEKASLLPSSLYPALHGREMVCTREAAVRFRQIVETIGTPAEKERAAQFMGDDPSLSPAALHQALQSGSEHKVPADLRLPIRVIDGGSWKENREAKGEQEMAVQEELANEGCLPKVADHVAAQLSSINRSVFLYGWRAGLTTVTSNKTVAKQIEATILDALAGSGDAAESDGSASDLVGPHIWLCMVARSLIGKNRRKANGVVAASTGLSKSDESYGQQSQGE